MRRIAALLAALGMADPAMAADLSPARWPAAERARLEAAEQSSFPATARTLTGRRELVSATLSPIAVHAGMEALRQGGTAADAAVAVALTQTATDLGSVVSYAGVAQAVYFEARTRKVYALGAGWGSYRDERAPLTIPKADLSLLTGAVTPAPTDVGRMTLTPGFMAGMAALNARFGRLPLADLLAPSIWYAEEGVPVNARLAAYFKLRRASFARTEPGRRFLAGAGGDLPAVGQRFRDPDLAATLRAVAQHGPGAMSSGAWGADFVAAVRAAGGLATQADLTAYAVRWGEPLSTGYAGATVYGPDGVSGCAVLAALNMLEAQGGSRLGPSWTDAAAFRAHDLATRFASFGGYLPNVRAFERAQGLGSTCADRVTPRYAQAVAPHLATLLAGAQAGEPGHHSASVVVVDRWGNVAALVHSGNSIIWGDTGLVVGGVPLPSPAGIYQARLAAVAPGAPIPGDMAPVIALKGGRPVAAVASVGSSLTPETLRITAGLLGAADPAELAAAPPMLIDFSGTPGRITAVPKGAYPPAFLDALRAEGLTLSETPAEQVAGLRGTTAFAKISKGALLTVETPGVITHGAAR